MKIVRILVFEGDETALKIQMKRSFVAPDRPWTPPDRRPITPLGVTIHEIFRGSMAEGVVEHLDANAFGRYRTELSAEDMDKDVVTVPPPGFEEEGPVKS